MKLQEQELPPNIRRRLKFDMPKKGSDLELIKKLILKHFSNDKNKTIDSALMSTALEIMFDSNFMDTEYSSIEVQEKIKKYLAKLYSEEINNYFDNLIKVPDDDYKYCFFKHSLIDLYSPKSSGFSDCVRGWYNFLSEYGSWFPDLNWVELKKLLDSQPNKVKLIKKPLDNIIYNYYFSVKKIGSINEKKEIKKMIRVINEEQNKPSKEEFIQALQDVKTIIPLISHKIIHEQGLEHNQETIKKLNKVILQKVKDGDDETLDVMWELAGSMIMKNAINIITFYTK